MSLKRTEIVIAIVIATAAAILVATFVRGDRIRITETNAMSNAKMLGLGCMQYAIDHGGNYPPSLDALVPDYLPGGASLASPLRPSERIGYIYFPGLKDTSPPDAVLLKDKFESGIVIHRDDSATITKIP